jgi:hypothetical protein
MTGIKKPAPLPYEPIKLPKPDLDIREDAPNFNLRVQEEQNARRIAAKKSS